MFDVFGHCTVLAGSKLVVHLELLQLTKMPRLIYCELCIEQLYLSLQGIIQLNSKAVQTSKPKYYAKETSQCLQKNTSR